MRTPERLVAFCQGIQMASPIDSMALPEPWDMPGYNDQVVMAAGTFVAGASIELSADAPHARAVHRLHAGRADLHARANRAANGAEPHGGTGRADAEVIMNLAR